MKKILFSLLVLGLIALGGFWYKRPHEEPLAVNSPVVAHAKLTMTEVKNQPVPRQELDAAKGSVASDIPAECLAQWESVAASSFQQFNDDLKRGVLRLNPECLKFEGDAESVKQVYAACVYDAEHGTLADEKACFAAAGLYRTLLTDRLTQDQKDYRSMSLSLLANKIIAAFQTMNQDPRKRAEAKDMIDALIEREPGFFEARKALVAVSMADLDDATKNQEQLQSAIDNAMALNPRDPQLTEVYLFNEMMRGRPETLDAYLDKNPDSAAAFYYRAWNASRAGNREQALADLQHASQLAPGDTRISHTLSELQAGHDKNAFTITVGFTFDDI